MTSLEVTEYSRVTDTSVTRGHHIPPFRPHRVAPVRASQVRNQAFPSPCFTPEPII